MSDGAMLKMFVTGSFTVSKRAVRISGPSGLPEDFVILFIVA